MTHPGPGVGGGFWRPFWGQNRDWTMCTLPSTHFMSSMCSAFRLSHLDPPRCVPDITQWRFFSLSLSLSLCIWTPSLCWFPLLLLPVHGRGLSSIGPSHSLARADCPDPNPILLIPFLLTTSANLPKVTLNPWPQNLLPAPPLCESLNAEDRSCQIWSGPKKTKGTNKHATLVIHVSLGPKLIFFGIWLSVS